MKKTIVTLITLFVTAYYIYVSISNNNFSNKTVLLGFFIFILPYVLRNLINIYFLTYSLFNKAKDIDDSNLTTIVSLLGTNLTVFVGLFINLYNPNPDVYLSTVGSLLSLAVYPFYFAALITLGRNFTVLPEANSLNTKGVYSISRHPLYVCYIAWFIFQGLVMQTLAMAIVSAIQVVFLVMRAKYEEKVLERNFPEYKEYKQNVWWLGRVKRLQ
jgi:protein-S-isoprenylcysteine O-methyltransferase Ste14